MQATIVTKERTRTDGPRAGFCTRAEFFKGSAALAAVAAAQTSVAAPVDGIFAGMTGMHAPLFTPLDREGRVVEDRVAPVMEWLLANGMRGFYVTGGTGEGVKMRVGERRRMLAAVARENRGRGKLIAHVGANDVDDAVTLAKAAADAGYDWLAAVRPAAIAGDYDAMYAYYDKIASATPLPFMIYSWMADIDPVRDARFFDIPNVRGMKYTGYAYWKVHLMKERLSRETIFFAGADEQLICAFAFRGLFSGGIGTTYNIIPRIIGDLYRAALAGDVARAHEMQMKDIAIIDACRACGGGIAGWKAIMRYLGFDQGFAAGEPGMISGAKYAALAKRLDRLGFVKR